MYNNTIEIITTTVRVYFDFIASHSPPFRDYGRKFTLKRGVLQRDVEQGTNEVITHGDNKILPQIIIFNAK